MKRKISAGRSPYGYVSESIRDDVYNAVAEVLSQYENLSAYELRKYTKKAFDWFMDKYFMYDFDDLNG